VSDDYGWLITDAAAQRSKPQPAQTLPPAWLDGVVRGAQEKEGLNHQVVSSNTPPPIPPMPGILRKSTVFLSRYQKFDVTATVILTQVGD
jgi:hypothetical protein